MTTCVDFDGVVHAYSLGWNGGEIYDEPVPGAIEALQVLLAAGPVVIFTARQELHLVANWLRGHGVPAVLDTYPPVKFWRGRDTVLVTNRKLPAQVYVDDRGVTFKTWEQTMWVLLHLGVITDETYVEWESAQRPDGEDETPSEAELLRDAVREYHPRDNLGFCQTCKGAYDEYGRRHDAYLWPCPTLRAVGVTK